jgi:predicted transcriptional regulator with HTH domain
MIAQKAGTTRTMVRYALRGRLPYYRRDLSPLALGLVQERKRVGRPAFRLSAEGKRVAAELALEARSGQI